MHERTGWPSRCTVQAPHCAMPQPNLVPVSPRTSRSTQSSGMSSGAATSWSFPFTLIFITDPPPYPSPRRGRETLLRALPRPVIRLDTDPACPSTAFFVAIRAQSIGAEAEVRPTLGEAAGVLHRRLRRDPRPLEEAVAAGRDLLRGAVQLQHQDRLVGEAAGAAERLVRFRPQVDMVEIAGAVLVSAFAVVEAERSAHEDPAPVALRAEQRAGRIVGGRRRRARGRRPIAGRDEQRSR